MRSKPLVRKERSRRAFFREFSSFESKNPGWNHLQIVPISAIMAKLRPLFLTVLPAFLVLVGCASPKKNSQAGLRNGEKAIAKVLATSVVAPVRFRDTEAMNHLTRAASNAADLAFVVVLDEKGAKLSESTNERTTTVQRALIGTVQQRIQTGEMEFEFQENGLRVAVVPIDLEGEARVGFVAVASM